MSEVSPGDMVEYLGEVYRVSHYCDCEPDCSLVFLEDETGGEVDADECDLYLLDDPSFGYPCNTSPSDGPYKEKGFSIWIRGVENVTN